MKILRKYQKIKNTVIAKGKIDMNNFDIFRPSLNNIKNYSMQDKRYKTELLNSYDNSILYTDYVLNELIEILKMQKDTKKDTIVDIKRLKFYYISSVFNRGDFRRL